MDTSRLKLFIKLAETCHFQRAAELCHVSPPTLTRNIQQLEEALNCKLFERSNRSVLLTRAGESFLPEARELLRHWETLKESLASQTQELSGSISIYCSVTASYSFLYDILAEFRRAHPGIAITLHTGDPALAMQRVVNGEEDIAITARPETLPGNLEFSRFSSSPLIFIAPQNDQLFFENKKDNKQVLQDVPMIIPERGLARERLNSWFRKMKITPQLYAQVSGNEAIVSMVSLGFGIGLVPKIVVDNSPLAKKVKAFSIQPDLKPYDVGVCVLSRRLRSPLVHAFWQQLKNRI